MVSYTVGQLAALAHVTVRALHHYDEIGLLKPSTRTEAGYRRYTERDLERLQQLLFYRELGFPLDQIAALLDGDMEPQAHLRTQRQLLTEVALAPSLLEERTHCEAAGHGERHRSDHGG